MAKLFKFEKEMRDLINVLRINEPYDFCYENRYSSIGSEGKLNNNTKYFYDFDFYHHGDNNYFEVSVGIGSRTYVGLFYYADYKFIYELVDKFISINT